jgi:hypothetical protein
MDHDDLLVIRVPSTVLNPALDRRPRASDDAKIRDRLSIGTAAVRGLCSLMGQGGSLFRMSTLSGACVLCALAGA